jgi:hypothetical protein
LNIHLAESGGVVGPTTVGEHNIGPNQGLALIQFSDAKVQGTLIGTGSNIDESRYGYGR